MLYYERKLKKQGYNLIIGVDEAGRGPLAGPVVAAAVALKTHYFRNRIDDSKKLTAQSREKAYLEIINKSVFGVGIVDEKIIDRVNILQATRIAMEQAVRSLIDKLTPPFVGVQSFQRRAGLTSRKNNRIHPALRWSPKLSTKGGVHVIVDGNVAINIAFPYTNIIKGDSKSKTIACASILAKVTRDRLMLLYDRIYPAYRFLKHKGYPTKEHRLILRRLGPTIIHRKSFAGI